MERGTKEYWENIARAAFDRILEQKKKIEELELKIKELESDELDKFVNQLEIERMK